MLLEAPVLGSVLGNANWAWLSRINTQDISDASFDEFLLFGDEQLILLLSVSGNIAF